MSNAAVRTPLAEAVNLGKYFIEQLQPGCERIEFAGSVRRQRRDVGDVEVVCIPRVVPDMFGGESTATWLDTLIPHLAQKGRVQFAGADGPRLKKFWLAEGLKLDLFITDAQRWPVCFALRTGGQSFSKQLVTVRKDGGLLPSNLRVRDNLVWDGRQPLDLTSERDFLELCGGWIAPEARP